MAATSPDRVALVTGGARGIGAAIADALMPDYAIAITCRTTQPDPALNVFALPCELTDAGAVQGCIDAVITRFGRLDVIVNNAGIASGSPLASFDAESARSMLDVNLLAPHALLAAALPHLQPGSAVVNISSVNAVLPPVGASLFGASKAALELWTRGAARELGPRGIRVNAVAPGAVDVDDAPRPEDMRAAFVGMTALGRLATPVDIANAVRFLVSDAAACITGEVLTVAGGYRL